MTARARLVHFVPDPFNGGRVPVCALVDTGDLVQVIEAPHLPGPGCVGGREAFFQMKHLVETVTRERLFDPQPGFFGQHAVVGEPISIPVDARDPIAWALGLLPRQLALEDREERHPRGPTRASLGYGFFERRGLADRVFHTFDPVRNMNGVFRDYQRTLKGITHWGQSGSTSGRMHALFFEPVRLDKKNLDKELTEVAQRFNSARAASADLGDKAPVTLRIAYVLKVGDSDRRRTAIRELTPYSSHVFDLATERGGSELEALVRAHAARKSDLGEFEFPN